jgi:hypothetical protein
VTQSLIDAWNRVNVLSAESAYDFYLELTVKISDEQEKIPMDELANDEFRFCQSTPTIRIFEYAK